MNDKKAIEEIMDNKHYRRLAQVMHEIQDRRDWHEFSSQRNVLGLNQDYLYSERLGGNPTAKAIAVYASPILGISVQKIEKQLKEMMPALDRIVTMSGQQYFGLGASACEVLQDKMGTYPSDMKGNVRAYPIPRIM